MINNLIKKYENGGFVDERAYGTQLYDYLFGGVSPSEYQGAHTDINKLIANADAATELASLFNFSSGRDVVEVFRHLNPADSTVTLRTGLADQYYRNENIPFHKLTRLSAQDSDETSQLDAARMLAKLRNQYYSPFPNN